MNFKVNDKDYTIKSKQAIEILSLVEKSGLFDKVKEMNLTRKPEDFPKIVSLVPVSYQLAHSILSIALGKQEAGKVIPDTDIVDELEALQLPILASQIVKALVYPITYVITSDPEIEAEKKSDTNAEVSDGKPEKSPDPKV